MHAWHPKALSAAFASAVLVASGAIGAGTLAGASIGCAATAGKPTAPRPRLATATEVTVRDEHPRAIEPRRAKLHYRARGRAFPLPLVRGTIAGHRVTMLVDTGANSHVVAGWFARKHGLAMQKLGDVGTDHVGKSIATFRLDSTAISIDEWGALAPSPVLATDVPEVIEKLGIGAFISPQRLVDDGEAVILDLVSGELRGASWDAAYDEMSKRGVPLVAGSEARVCEENEGPIKGLAFVLPATVESHKVELLLDTGAQHSDIFTASTAGQRLASRSAANKEPMYTASGRISARKLKSARVASGSFSVVTDVDLIGGVSDASCPRDGVLAMDVLRSCTLLLGKSRVYGRCNESKRTPDVIKGDVVKAD